MKIKGFRMRSGEDIICELTDTQLNETDFAAGDEFHIRKPVVPVTMPERGPNGQPIQNGREMLQLLKWVPYSLTDEYVINRADFVVSYDIPKEIEDYYIQATSNIQIAGGMPPGAPKK